LTAAPAGTSSLASTLVDDLLALGVEEAFGVSGGAMAMLWHAMSASRLRVRHFRHESGAAFAATEASLATSRPVLLFTTTGPGLTNALTGLLAARDEGATLIAVSACTSAGLRRRFAIQESGPQTLPRGLYESGPLFHFAHRLEDERDWPDVARQLTRGIGRRRGFVAHIAVPTVLQSARVERTSGARIGGAARGPGVAHRTGSLAADAPSPDALQSCLRALGDEPFAVWVGFGARCASAEILALTERTGAAVICTPRGKGIVPEAHPRFVGVTGIGGHEAVPAWVAEQAPARILVLGSRLGEPSSLFDPRLVPRRGFVHVDIDAEVPGRAFPEAPTLPVVADAATLLRELLPRLPPRSAMPPALPVPPLAPRADSPGVVGRIHPAALMDAIQRQAIDASEAIVLAESGNAFVWATHRLRFATPGRYRASTGVGAMGHAAAGVVGAALAGAGRAVAVVGDGAMLMHNEINTAVKYRARAAWIVLNDGRYGMCEQGMAMLGLTADARFPEVDFVAFARAQGADGVRVADPRDLDAALRQALRADGPFVVDVLVDPTALAPANSRNRGLARQLATSSGGEISFPAHSTAPSSA
jgi:acetolactate synthase-1/2/3 large subunit